MSYDRTKKKIWRRKIKMERIGVEKKIDKLGRICIPKEMRKLFKLEEVVELRITPEGILIRNAEYVLVKKDKK